MKWFQDVESITRDLIGISSINSEKACADAIVKHLSAPIDNEHPNWQIFRWKANYHDTSTVERGDNIACLLEGEHPEKTGDTLILMGHYDTVGVNDFDTIFGHSEIAFNPNELHQSIRSRIDTGAITNQRVIDDAQETFTIDGQEEPAWLFGRGSVDMKSGIAIIIAVLRALWQHRKTLKGKILFLACPDEETNSAGILSAIEKINALAEEKTLHPLGVINTDYTVARDDKRQERYVYTGTIGKLLPSFYILGATTHVGEPFRGLDATQVAAEIIRAFNLNVDLSDSWEWDSETEIAVPPIVLKMRDLKSAYDVQTAPAAFAYINWLTYNLSPADVMQKSIEIARDALRTVDEQRHLQFQQYKQAGEEASWPPPLDLSVITFEDLMQAVVNKKGFDNVGQVNDLIRQYITDIHNDITDYQEKLKDAGLDNEAMISLHMEEGYDERELSRLVVQQLAQDAELHAPAVIVYFSPPYYPHIKPQENILTDTLRTLIANDAFQRQLNALSKNEGRMVLRGFYPYISDMSFVMLEDDVFDVIDVLTSNMPLYQSETYRLPLDAIAQLGCPVINLGPYGENAHGVFERVNKPFSFELVPQLLYDLVREILR